MIDINKLTEALKSALDIEDTSIDSVEEFMKFIMNWKDVIEMDQVVDYKNFQNRHRNIMPNKSKITIHPFPTQEIKDNTFNLNLQMSRRLSSGTHINFPETREISIDLCGREFNLLNVSLIYGYTYPISFSVGLPNLSILQSLYKFIYSIAAGREFSKNLFNYGFERYKGSNFLFSLHENTTKQSFTRNFMDFQSIYCEQQQDIHNNFEDEIENFISIEDLIQRKNAHNKILKEVYLIDDYIIASMEKYGNKGIYKKINN